LLAYLLCTAPFDETAAHHSVFAVYDINGSVTIDGVVTEVWSNHLIFACSSK
jgi:hypothetical protein